MQFTNINQEIVSYSGSDIRAIISVPGYGSHAIDNLHTFSLSMYRDKPPVRSIGNKDALAHVRGVRTLAGSMVFINFTEHALHNVIHSIYLQKHKKTGLALTTDFFDTTPDDISPFNMTILFNNNNIKTHRYQSVYTDQYAYSYDKQLEAQIENSKLKNPKGYNCKYVSVMRIIGIDIVNAGNVYGVDESQIETTMQYKAIKHTPMYRIPILDS